MDFSSELKEALQEKTLVRIARGAFEETCPEFDGYVLGFGETLVCLAILDDRIRFNGIEVFYKSQISELEAPTPHATFFETAVRLRGDRVPELPPLDMSSMKSVLESLSKIAPLVVIHREVQEPDICEIGQIAGVEAKTFQLREIDPDADWADEPTEFRYEDISRVGFGGEYESALALVAGVVL
jgi:hypothetical protein